MSIESEERDRLRRDAFNVMRSNRDRQISDMKNRAALGLALDMGLVQSNEAGKALILNVVEPWMGKFNEPTVRMVRLAVDSAIREAKRA